MTLETDQHVRDRQVAAHRAEEAQLFPGIKEQSKQNDNLVVSTVKGSLIAVVSHTTHGSVIKKHRHKPESHTKQQTKVDLPNPHREAM